MIKSYSIHSRCLYIIYIYIYVSLFSADIVFIVKDKPHPIFKRDDDNLIYTASVPLGQVTMETHFRIVRRDPIEIECTH